MKTRKRGKVTHFTNIGINIPPDLRDRLERHFEQNERIKRTYWYEDAVREKLDREEMLGTA